MALNIGVWDTFVQAPQYYIEVPENEFLLRHYFPFDEQKDTFPTKKVELDFDGPDLKAGAFVRRGFVNGEVMHERATYVEPPRIAPSTEIDPNDLDRKLFERIEYALGENRAEAYEQLKRVKAIRLGRRILRSIEKTIVNVLLNNGVHGTIIDDAANPSDISEIDINYYDEEQGNTQRFKPNVAWSPAGAAAGTCTPYNDICEMVNELIEHGGYADEVLMSPQAWMCLIKDPDFKDQFSLYHTVDMYLMGENVREARRMASAVFLGYHLDIVVYSGKYEDEDGVEHHYLPKGFVCVTSPNCGRTLAGGFTKLKTERNGDDPMINESFVARRGLIIMSEYKDFDKEKLHIRSESRPLPAPYREWQWITADMMNTNEISDGTAGVPVVSLVFSCEEYDDAVLPTDLTNQLGGSKITIADATSADATTDGKSFEGWYVNGVKLTKDGDGKYTVPNNDSELVAVFA